MLGQHTRVPRIMSKQSLPSPEEVLALPAQSVNLKTCGLSGCYLKSKSSELVYYRANLDDTLSLRHLQ